MENVMEKEPVGCYNRKNSALRQEGRGRIMYGENTILIVGQAKPSKEDAIYSLHGEFYVSFVVERDTGTILDVECNTILAVTSRFVTEMLVGKSLKSDLEAMETSIRERYYALTQKPLIACIKDAHNRYMMVTGQKERRVR